MIQFGRKRKMIQAFILVCLFLFAGSGFAGSMGDAKIIPNGKVIIYDGNQKVGELTTEAPFPENKILRVTGKSGVKMDSIYLVATDKTSFSAQTKDPDKVLELQHGKVFFGITSMPYPMTFITPKGAVVAQKVMFQTSSGNALMKGYISVTEKDSEIGIIEGGSMIISTADGEIKLDAGNRLILAQVTEQSECEAGVTNYVKCPDNVCKEGEYCDQGECKECKSGILPPPLAGIGTGGAVALGALAISPIIISVATQDDDKVTSVKQ